MKNYSIKKPILTFLFVLLSSLLWGQRDYYIGPDNGHNYEFGSSWDDITSFSATDDSYKWDEEGYDVDGTYYVEILESSGNYVSIRSVDGTIAENYKNSIPDAFSYTFRVHFQPKKTDTYSSKYEDITIDRTPKIITVKVAEPIIKEYDGTKKYTGEISYSFTGDKNENIESLTEKYPIVVKNTTVEFSNSEAGACSVNVSFELENSEFYKIEKDPVSVSGIITKPVTLSLDGISKDYDGTNTITSSNFDISKAQLVGIADGADVTVKSLSLEFDGTDCPSQPVKILSYELQGTDAKYYSIDIEHSNLKGNISPAPAEIKVTKNTYIYGDKLDLSTIYAVKKGSDTKLDGNFSFYNVEDDGDGNKAEGDIEYTADDFLPFGTYDIYIQFEPNSPNYIWPALIKEFIVEQKIVNLTVSYDKTKVYDKTYNVNNFSLVADPTDFIVGNDEVILPNYAYYISGKDVGVDKEISLGSVGGKDSYKYNFYIVNNPLSGDITPYQLKFNEFNVTNGIYGTATIKNCVDFEVENPFGEIDNFSIKYFINGSEVSDLDLLPVGTNSVTITVSANNNNYIDISKTFDIEVSKLVAEFNVADIDIDKEKIYDQTTDVVVNNNSIILSNAIANDNVFINIVSANYDDKNVGTDKKITLSLGLDGTAAANYELKTTELEFCNDGIINKKEIEIKDYNFTVSDKPYNEKTDIVENQIVDFSVTSLEPVIFSGDDANIEIDETSIAYVSANTGNDVEITAIAVIVGNDAENYQLKNSNVTTKGNIIAGIPYFKVENTHFIYGDSKIGEDFVVKISTDENENITYSYDDFEMRNNLPPGEHQIKIFYEASQSSNYDSKDTVVTVTVEKRQLEYTKVIEEMFVTTRVYNGSDVCSLKDLPDVDALTPIYLHWNSVYSRYDNDQVAIKDMVGHFDTPEIGIHKPITITFTITGSESDYYIAPQPYVYPEGVILPGEIKADLQLNKVEFCSGGSDNLELLLTIHSGVPDKYEIVFDNAAIAAGFENIAETDIPSYETEEEFAIVSNSLPKTVEYGKFSGVLKLYSTSTKGELELPFNFSVDLDPSEIILTKFDDVVFVDNHELKYVGYQWYKDGQIIDGATNQFYNDLEGVFKGKTYYAVLNTANGEVVKTCPIQFEKNTASTSKKSDVYVKTYPNPAKSLNPINIQLIGDENLQTIDTEIYIYNNLGVLVEKISNANSINTILLPEGQYNGVYLLGNKKLTFKLIVK